MKPTTRIRISTKGHTHFKVGDIISQNTVIASDTTSILRNDINIAKVLGVENNTILRYMKKQMQEMIDIGEVIAQKKNLFSSVVLHSPVHGTIDQVDLAKGTLTIVSTEELSTTQTFPIEGKVTKVEDEYVEIEIKHTVLRLEEGKGSDVIGLLRLFSKDMLEYFDVEDNMEGVIALAKAMREETFVKLDVLGVKGAILQQVSPDITISWGRIKKEMFDRLSSFDGKNVWFRPKEKEVIIIQ